MGEAGTLAGASSLATSPDVIYAGGQNNGVSRWGGRTPAGPPQLMRCSFVAPHRNMYAPYV